MTGQNPIKMVGGRAMTGQIADAAAGSTAEVSVVRKFPAAGHDRALGVRVAVRPTSAALTAMWQQNAHRALDSADAYSTIAMVSARHRLPCRPTGSSTAATTR